MIQADFFPTTTCGTIQKPQPSGAGFAGRGRRSRYTANCSIRVLTKLQFSILRTHPKEDQKSWLIVSKIFELKCLGVLDVFLGVSNLTPKKSRPGSATASAEPRGMVSCSARSSTSTKVVYNRADVLGGGQKRMGG